MSNADNNPKHDMSYNDGIDWDCPMKPDFGETFIGGCLLNVLALVCVFGGVVLFLFLLSRYSHPH